MKLTLFVIGFTLLLILGRYDATTPAPSRKPSKSPTQNPTARYTGPMISRYPTQPPSVRPTAPSKAPTTRPTLPSKPPTTRPSNPSMQPTIRPSNPSARPTAFPTIEITGSILSLAPPPLGVLVTFNFTGYSQNFTVPAGVTELNVTLVGASGGSVGIGTTYRRGGRGALITSIFPVSPGEVYQIFVGGQGSRNIAGYNGGGAGKGHAAFHSSGGGSTDLRAYPHGIDDRMMVGGGGGGASANCLTALPEGGDAGWPNGFAAPACDSYPTGQGGKQDSSGGDFATPIEGEKPTGMNKGSFFYGGEGITLNNKGYGGAGGGGYYGGGASYGSGGGGGSSYSNYPIFKATNGTWVGDGSAWITYVVGGTDPTISPTLQPSGTPSVAAPTFDPTADPSRAPSLHPSTTPSAMPSEFPSQDPTAGPTYTVTAPIPTAPPSFAPSANPSVGPSATPSADPSVSPSVLPSAMPSVIPSAPTQPIPTINPTLAPTLEPTRAPTTDPTASPTLYPTTEPTFAPTTDPTAAPTLVPTAEPTFAPTTDPTAAPTLMPTAEPTFAPTTDPTAAPTLVPTAEPTLSPTTDPAVTPTLVPTVGPTLDPTHQPTVNPSFAPTNQPTKAPSLAPSAKPTARPTLQSVKPYEVVLNVEQDVYFINKVDYDSQKVQCNFTIQHTVAASLDGVVPERVTDIVVEEAETAKMGNMRAHAATIVTPPVSLKYKVTVYDPVLSAEVLTKQLVTKVQCGDMDNAFRAFAVTFNATNMQNGTFSVPRVTVLNEVRRDDPVTASETAGIVIGAFIFVMLLSVGVWLLVGALKKKREEKEEKSQDLQSKSTVQATGV